MKPHFIIKFREGAPYTRAPYWADLTENKSYAVETLGKELDAVIRKQVPGFWVTHEFKPAGNSGPLIDAVNWTTEERRAGLDRIYRLISMQDDEIPHSLISELTRQPQVEKAYSGTVGVAELPEQNLSAAQATFTHTAAQQIFLEEAQQFSKGEKAIKIAVLDTGVDYTHPEFRHAMTEGMDFVDIIDGAGKFIGDFLGEDAEPLDEVGHGSHVTGIIAAKGLKMPAGVVPGCTIMPVRVLGAMNNEGRLVGAGLIDNISAGIKWAVDNGADIINMSLGVKHSGGGLPHKEVIDYAVRKGVTVVAASGNDGTSDKYYPGALKDVIAVGAIDYSGTITGFSTYGKHISLVAPGYQVYSAGLQHGYAFASGTSQASPFVAGAVGLLKSYAYRQGKKLDNHYLKYVLKLTADRNFKGYKDIKYGYGKINLIDAIRHINYQFNNL